jgi:hypothetical protein
MKIKIFLYKKIIYYKLMENKGTKRITKINVQILTHIFRCSRSSSPKSFQRFKKDNSQRFKCDQYCRMKPSVLKNMSTSIWTSHRTNIQFHFKQFYSSKLTCQNSRFPSKMQLTERNNSKDLIH